MKTNLSKSEKPTGNKVFSLKILKPIPPKSEPLLKTAFIKIGGIEIY